MDAFRASCASCASCCDFFKHPHTVMLNSIKVGDKIDFKDANNNEHTFTVTKNTTKDNDTDDNTYTFEGKLDNGWDANATFKQVGSNGDYTMVVNANIETATWGVKGHTKATYNNTPSQSLTQNVV